MSEILKSFGKITTFIFDVDGVLTDGTVLITEDGDMLRNMNIKDGYALQLAVKLNYQVVIITGGSSSGVVKRLNGLGIQHIFSGAHDKLSVFNQFIQDHSIDPQECLYMGDDMPDIAVMNQVLIASCPADACTDVKENSNYISPFSGGKGCVRDVVEKTLRIKGDWAGVKKHYW